MEEVINLLLPVVVIPVLLIVTDLVFGVFVLIVGWLGKVLQGFL